MLIYHSHIWSRGPSVKDCGVSPVFLRLLNLYTSERVVFAFLHAPRVLSFGSGHPFQNCRISGRVSGLVSFHWPQQEILSSTTGARLCVSTCLWLQEVRVDAVLATVQVLCGRDAERRAGLRRLADRRRHRLLRKRRFVVVAILDCHQHLRKNTCRNINFFLLLQGRSADVFWWAEQSCGSAVICAHFAELKSVEIVPMKACITSLGKHHSGVSEALIWQKQILVCWKP